MIKVLAQPTNNAEQFRGQRQGGKFKCEHFTKFCLGLDENFGLHRINISAFAVCFNVVQSILFWQNIKISSPVVLNRETRLPRGVSINFHWGTSPYTHSTTTWKALEQESVPPITYLKSGELEIQDNDLREVW